MKRVAYLFLCFLVLFCVGCKKEVPSTDSQNSFLEEFVPEISADSFYTYDGDLYNVYVSLTLTTTELTAPVTTLSFEIKNDTDYILYFSENTANGYKWEKWEDGKWTSFYKNTDQEIIRNELIAQHDILSPRTTVTRTETFVFPLEAGVYRLRRNYRLTNEKEMPFAIEASPGVECVVETYFTILPTPQG